LGNGDSIGLLHKRLRLSDSDRLMHKRLGLNDNSRRNSLWHGHQRAGLSHYGPSQYQAQGDNC
jgi:hypothetical protein